MISVDLRLPATPPPLLQQQLRHGSHQEEDRAKEVFQSKADENATYDGVAKKLATCEGDLEEAEEHADIAEDKIIELEEELRVVAHNLKSLEVAEEKANRRDETCDKLQKDSESWEEEATKSEEDLVFVGDTMMQLEKAKKGVLFKSLESIFSFSRKYLKRVLSQQEQNRI